MHRINDMNNGLLYISKMVIPKSLLRALILVCASSLALAEQSADHDAHATIDAAFDRPEQQLRLKVTEQDFKDVVDQVGKLSGTRFVVMGTGYADLTIDFDYLPLQEALKAILKDTSYLLVDSGDHYEAWVFSPGETETYSAIPADETSVAETAGGDSAKVQRVVKQSDLDFSGLAHFPGLEFVPSQIRDRREVQDATPPEMALLGSGDNSRNPIEVGERVRAYLGTDLPPELMETLAPADF